MTRVYQIDRHNCCQGDFDLEKKFEVKEWSMRVNTPLLAICVVDAWTLYCGGKGDGDRMKPNQFYSELADGLIDNKHDKITMRQRWSDSDSNDDGIEMGSGIRTHLTPTNRKRKTADGNTTSACYHGRCTV